MTEHFTHEGFDFTMEIVDDNDHEPPWDDGDGDGRGIVSDWRSFESKRPGEVLLHRDRRSCRFYNWEATIAKAALEDWGLCDADEAALAKKLKRKPTRKQIIAESVRRDFEHMRGWCNDEWRYVGVVVTVNFETDGGAESSLWGIENSDSAFITETRNELAHDLLPASKFECEMRRAIA